MNKKIIIIIAFIASFFVYKNYFADSDKKEIRAVISDLEQSLEYTKKLPPIAVFRRFKTVESKLAPGFSAKSIADERERKADIEKIQQGAAAAARYFSVIDIFSLPARIDVNGEKATASFHITITGRDQQGGEFKELFDMVLDLKKIEGKWLCSSLVAERLTPED